MELKNIKEFDKIVGEKLSGYTEQPSRDLFARIEKSLGERVAPAVVAPVAAVNKAPKRIMLRVYRYAAVAVVLAGVVFITTRTWNTEELQQVVAEEFKASESQRGDIMSPNDEVHDNTIAVNDIPTNFTEPDATIVSIKSGLSNMLSPEDMTNFTEVNTSSVSAPLDGNARYPLAGRNRRTAAADAEIKRRMEIERNMQIENYWGSLFGQIAEESNRGRNLNNTPVTSLYAGNFGTGSGNIEYSDLSKIAVANMLIKEGSNTIPSGAILLAQNNQPTGEPSIKLRHAMPLNVGLSLMFPVNDKISIVSGLNYSYLYSSSTQQMLTTGGEGSIKQELHYVGIPVGVMYSFYRSRAIDFYARGGAAVEKAVYAQRTTDYGTGSKPEVAKMGAKGVQFSLDGALGANFRIARTIGLYLEPGVAYYFEGGNESSNFGAFTSYRTDNPVNFTLRIGVRFNL